MRLIFAALISLILVPAASFAGSSHDCPELEGVRHKLSSMTESMTHADFWVSYEPGRSDATGMDYVGYRRLSYSDETAAIDLLARRLLIMARTASCGARFTKTSDALLVAWHRRERSRVRASGSAFTF